MINQTATNSKQGKHITKIIGTSLRVRNFLNLWFLKRLAVTKENEKLTVIGKGRQIRVCRKKPMLNNLLKFLNIV